MKDFPSCKICGHNLTTFLQNLFDDRHGYPGRFDIFRCKQCGFGQTAPEIAEDQLGALYTEYYPRKSLALEEMKKRSFAIPSLRTMEAGNK